MKPPATVILLISSEQDWLKQLAQHLTSAGRKIVTKHVPDGAAFQNSRPTEPTSGAIATLIRAIADIQPQVLVLDQAGLSADSRAVIASSPATRRITQHVIGATAAEMETVAEAIAELEADPPPTINCQRALLPEAIEGIALFNAGDYYTAHDPLEAAWNQETAPDRDLYRALLQVSVGYHHITKGNYRGAVKLLLRAKQWLAKLPDQCRGVEIGAFRANAVDVEAALLRLGPDNIADFDTTLIKPIVYHPIADDK